MALKTPPKTGAREISTSLYCYGVTWAETARPQQAAGLAGKSVEPVRFEELVAREMQARTNRDARAILDRLGLLALGQEVDEEPIEHQVLRASFLVERKRVPAFDAAMEDIASGQAGRIDFKYVGPLPPHSFV